MEQNELLSESDKIYIKTDKYEIVEVLRKKSRLTYGLEPGDIVYLESNLLNYSKYSLGFKLYSNGKLVKDKDGETIIILQSKVDDYFRNNLRLKKLSDNLKEKNNENLDVL